MILARTKPDIMFLIGVITLVGVGLVLIYSSSSIIATDQHGDSLYFLKRQIVWLWLGIIAFLVGRSIDYHFWAKLSKPLLILGVILLWLTLDPFFAREVNDARRWLRVGSLSFQTSEYVRVALVIYLAEILSRKKREIKSFKSGFLPPLFILAVISLLIIRQPHLGMVFMVVSVGGIMIFIAGARLIHLFYLFTIGLSSLYLLIFKFGYGKARLLSCINPWVDADGSGYQIIQSLIALGGGGLLGKGLGNSQQKLFYLPCPHTDFIFAIIGEEIGFLGAMGVVLLFFWFAFWGMRIAINAKDSFGSLLGLGLVSMIVIQALLNMGVVTGIFPITGLPLPFISVGGSNLLLALFSVGIILNISRTSLKSRNGSLVCAY